MLTFLSHRISGDIDEKCNVIYGPAKNGKSVFILMIRKLFGDFAKIITSDNVNEDDKLLHSRHLHIMESPADETMIKFVNNHCQDPAFSFLFVCNSKPDFNKFEEKVNYFNFNTSFINKDMKKTNDNQEYEDPSYINKVVRDEWVSALMWMLIHHKY